MSYSHLTITDRIKIETYMELGLKPCQIASKLGVHKSTIADAYSSWQRGSNENANGLLREYFPKKTDLAAISDEALNKALYDINHRPRKCLAYRTAYEALVDELE